jgi:hypothetical protein
MKGDEDVIDFYDNPYFYAKKICLFVPFRYGNRASLFEYQMDACAPIIYLCSHHHFVNFFSPTLFCFL